MPKIKKPKRRRLTLSEKEYLNHIGETRGEEVASALGIALERPVFDLAAAESEGLVQRVHLQVLTSFFKSLIQSADSEIGEETVLEAISHAVSELSSQSSASDRIDHRTSPDQTSSHQTAQAVETIGSDTEFSARLLRAVGQAKEAGHGVRLVINGVDIQAMPDRTLWIGFLTPDDFSGINANLNGSNLSSEYERWYTEDFMHIALGAVFLQHAENSKPQSIVVHFYRSTEYGRTGQLMSLGSAFTEDSRHSIESSSCAVKGTATTMTAPFRNDGECLVCCVTAHQDANGMVVQQNNHFAFPVVDLKTGEIVSPQESLANLIKRHEETFRIAFKHIHVHGVLICPQHRQLSAHVLDDVTDTSLVSPQSNSYLH